MGTSAERVAPQAVANPKTTTAAPAHIPIGDTASDDTTAARCGSFPRMAKSPCPVSKTQFLDKAEAVKITIGNMEIVADKREFSTGSFGWYYNGKTTVTVDGKPLSVQVGLNLTVVGSKEAER
jgi:hypothetical protein